MLALGLLSEYSGYTLLIAPFGASSFLLFGFPASPLVRKRNLVGGHLLTAMVGLLFLTFAPSSTLMMALAVGLGAFLMLATGTSHPPAGANPIVIMMTNAHWQFLLTPILAGVIFLLAVGFLHKSILRLPSFSAR